MIISKIQWVTIHKLFNYPRLNERVHFREEETWMKKLNNQINLNLDSWMNRSYQPANAICWIDI